MILAMLHHRCLLVGIASLAALVGACTNEPGALRLSVKPTKEVFRPYEPIVLTATLMARDKPVCLARSRWYDVEMIPVNAEAEVLRGSGQLASCGMGLLALVPVLPLVYTGSYLDVADTSARFDVLTPERKRFDKIQIALEAPNSIRLVLGRPIRIPIGVVLNRVANVDANQDRWPAGEYVASLRLKNQHLGFPPPLFWKPYSQPVQAETIVRISDDAKAPITSTNAAADNRDRSAQSARVSGIPRPTKEQEP